MSAFKIGVHEIMKYEATLTGEEYYPAPGNISNQELILSGEVTLCLKCKVTYCVIENVSGSRIKSAKRNKASFARDPRRVVGFVVLLCTLPSVLQQSAFIIAIVFFNLFSIVFRQTYLTIYSQIPIIRFFPLSIVNFLLTKIPLPLPKHAILFII